jgi:hypothetical protein
MGLLFEHDWPGNVPQLANVLERAAIMSTGEVWDAPSFGRLPGPGRRGRRGRFRRGPRVSLRQTLEDVERSMIEKALTGPGRAEGRGRVFGDRPQKTCGTSVQKHGIDSSRFSGSKPPSIASLKITSVFVRKNYLFKYVTLKKAYTLFKDATREAMIGRLWNACAWSKKAIEMRAKARCTETLAKSLSPASPARQSTVTSSH